MPPSELNLSHSRCFLSRYMFLTIYFLVLGQTDAEKTLKFVVLVFRHGDRSPTMTYPNDKYQEHSWPDGFGQLTQLGIEQHYELGKYLRKRYSGFLNETYSRHELISMPFQNCPLYNKLQTETYASKEYHDLVDPYKDFINSLQNDTGYSYEELNYIYNLWITYDALLCEQIHNYTLPDWATEDVMDKLSLLSDIFMSTMFGVYKQHEKSRLQGGVLVSSILKNITHAATTPSINLKLIMYSAHDTTIVALQMALNVYNGKTPPYAACHIFELYTEDNGEYTVEMYYQNDSLVDPYLVTLPGCSSSCPLAKFTELTSSIIAEDWEKECEAEVEEDKISGTVFGLIIAVVILSVAFLGLLILHCCWRKKSKNYKLVGL
ncbi:prostatic acid phosphatase [Bufo gargarizans]|uniref:prostatic acid phosphatase n=1 Tax=Bufo gargarizans TaxID=30331 RepID=UPI001CF13E03|nr:prostatic acid phosphatase [Bufo gargarizans]